MIVAVNAVLSWATFIVLVLVVLEAFTRWTLKVKAFFSGLSGETHTTNVEADVRAVMVDARDLNADPTAPTERIAAVTEYQQRRRRG